MDTCCDAPKDFIPETVLDACMSSPFDGMFGGGFVGPAVMPPFSEGDFGSGDGEIDEDVGVETSVDMQNVYRYGKNPNMPVSEEMPTPNFKKPKLISSSVGSSIAFAGSSSSVGGSSISMQDSSLGVMPGMAGAAIGPMYMNRMQYNGKTGKKGDAKTKTGDPTKKSKTGDQNKKDAKTKTFQGKAKHQFMRPTGYMQFI